MPLSPGLRLGPYEIQALLGAGGMGEVYRAIDTRLKRIVAVKVLPGEMAASCESRQRFQREARNISQLSHPHICTLYDFGQLQNSWTSKEYRGMWLFTAVTILFSSRDVWMISSSILTRRGNRERRGKKDRSIDMSAKGRIELTGRISVV
jgi:serine/threonine protein kinase